MERSFNQLFVSLEVDLEQIASFGIVHYATPRNLLP
jgi:hypothetical protein